MSVNVKTANFEGPFDLLLHLVQSKRVDIGSISVADVTDQYLSEVSKMVILDTETASDFMLVAATLLEIKAKALIPKETFTIEEVEELSPLEAREVLIQKLIVYKQFKNVAAEFRVCFDEESHHLKRTCGPTADFKKVAPDLLKNIAPEKMTEKAATLLGRRDQFLLASTHIAAKPLNVEVFAQTIISRCKVQGKIRFSELVKESPKREIVVVTLLAVLELYKRNQIDISQIEEFGDIEIDAKKTGENANV